jgi:uncharacterized protein DUF3300/endosialidase-like protein
MRGHIISRSTTEPSSGAREPKEEEFVTSHSAVFGRIRHVVAMAVLIVLALSPTPTRGQGATTTTRTLAQLEQLVAPIALYPDALLSQILMASTYPLEVVAAARWSQANPPVTGEALQAAMAQQPWDASVKALTAVPQTLQMMNDKLEWTQQLGDAFLAQQADVLDAVQRLRARADANGELKSTPEQKVTKTARAAGLAPPPGAPTTIYTIEPTNPDEYYVPIYDPRVVYGAWPYAEYEPFYWYPPGYAATNVYSFAAGVVAGAAIWAGVDWFRNRVQINPVRYNSFNRTKITNRNWTHNPAHRGAVPYRDPGVAQRFGDQRKSAAREGFREKADTGRRDLGKQGGPNAPREAREAARPKIATDRQADTNRKNAAGDRKTAAAKQTGSKQAARSKSTGRTKQAAANRESARKTSGGPRPSARTTAAPSSHVSRSTGARSAGMRAGGARHAGARGGGRRSDMRLKHDLMLLGLLDNGIGFYRFVYNGGEKAYVGVLAQEVQAVMPEAVARDRDGYLMVLYDKFGLPFQSYDHWIASGARIPAVGRTRQ